MGIFGSVLGRELSTWWGGGVFEPSGQKLSHLGGSTGIWGEVEPSVWEVNLNHGGGSFPLSKYINYCLEGGGP